MPVTVAVVGRSGAGKTTLIQALLPLLKDLGFRVATLKHTHHHINFDKPGSDTDCYRLAGAEQRALVGAGFCVLWFDGEREAEEMARLAGAGSDLLLVEGYKSGPFPRIEVIRGEAPLLQRGEAWLTLTSDQVEEALEAILELMRR